LIGLRQSVYQTNLIGALCTDGFAGEEYLHHFLEVTTGAESHVTRAG
jgi:hypothetical protein